MNLNPDLNWRWGLCLALTGAILAAIFWPREESPRAELGRLRREADTVFAAAIHDAVVGYHRTIRQSSDCWSGRWSEWKAEAEVEFVNKQGGIERTNIHFAFSVNSSGSDLRSHVTCSYDWRLEEAKRKQEQRIAAETAKIIPGETPQQFKQRIERAIAGEK